MTGAATTALDRRGPRWVRRSCAAPAVTRAARLADTASIIAGCHRAVAEAEKLALRLNSPTIVASASRVGSTATTTAPSSAEAMAGTEARRARAAARTLKLAQALDEANRTTQVAVEVANGTVGLVFRTVTLSRRERRLRRRHGDALQHLASERHELRRRRREHAPPSPGRLTSSQPDKATGPPVVTTTLPEWVVGGVGR